MLQKAIFSSGLKPVDVMMSQAGSPFAVAYPWAPGGGFGVKYSNPSPAIFTSSDPTGTRIAAAPNGRTVFVSGYNQNGNNDYTPLLTAIRWSASGFGTKYTSPSITGNSRADCVAVSPDGDLVVVTGNFSGPTSDATLVAAYPWNDSTGFGTKLTDPSLSFALPTFCRFNSGGDVIGFSQNSSSNTNYANFFPISTSGFGTVFSNPATAIGTSIASFRFTSSDNAVVFGLGPSSGDITNYLQAYAWSGSGFGSKYTVPTYTGAGIERLTDLVFSPDGTKLIFCTSDRTPGASMSNLGFVSWDSSTGLGSTITYPSTRVTALFQSVEISPDGDSILLANNASPRIVAYRWSSSGFGSTYSNPATLPSAGSNAIFVKRQ